MTNNKQNITKKNENFSGKPHCIRIKNPQWTQKKLLREQLATTNGYFLFDVLCSNIIKWKFNCLSTIYSIMHKHIAPWVLFFYIDYIFIFSLTCFQVEIDILSFTRSSTIPILLFPSIFFLCFIFHFNIQTLIPLMIAHNIYYLLFNFHILCKCIYVLYFFKHDSKMGNIRS